MTEVYEVDNSDDAILMKGVCAFIYGKYRLGRNEGPQSRKAYIIDSIKHPDEVEFLRRTYGDGFHLVGISDDYERRKSYLMDRKNLSERKAIDILNRDDNEKEKNGQHTRDAYQQADYFINAGDSLDETQANVFRLLDLLFGNPFISPTFEEYAMFRAYVSSLRSADLSRQIGVVVTKDDEILAEGVNDCPKAFGRVVHGEMEALMMCARNGISTKGCSMYMTTFPCHNCAKHIIAAGIEKVVYIEPYPKSKALDFYKIEISQDRKDIRKKVVFMPFKGVGPHRFVDLFSMQSIRWYARTRKQTNGYVVDWERNTANLRNPMGLLNYIDMEKSAYNQYAEEITGIGKEDENEYEKNSKA